MNQARWQQIEDLYYEALDRQGVERAEFLAACCQDDRDLFAEVSSLLSAYENSGDFLRQPDFELGLRLINKPKLSFRVNQNFGKYKILEFLGRGGMGEVYLAQDSASGRKVALKLLPRDIALDSNRVRRFRIEARAASRIVHPNVARVFEVGEIEDVHFIAMEFALGATLREHLKKGAMTPEQVQPIAEQIAAALVAAHRVGVVHRDLKPENIVLEDAKQVKVLDFSLAKLAQKVSLPGDLSATDDSNFLTETFKTQPGLLLGTTAYMSPEQIRGQEVDARTDIWSYGILLYEMLAGGSPFRRTTPIDTVAAILTAEPKPLDGADQSPELGKFYKIIEKSIAKNPDRRYQTANDLLTDLRKPASEFSLEKSGDENTDEKHRSNVTRRFSKGLAAVIIILLLALGAVLFTVIRQTGISLKNQTSEIARPEIKSIAVLPFQVLVGEEHLGLATADALIGKISYLKKLQVKPTQTISKVNQNDDPLTVGRNLNVDAALSGQIRQSEGRFGFNVRLTNVRDGTTVWEENFESDSNNVSVIYNRISEKVALSTLPELSPDERKLLLKHGTTNVEAYQTYLKGRYYLNTLTAEGLSKAVEHFRKAIDLDPVFALAYAGLADAYANGGDPEISFKDTLMLAKAAAAKAVEIDDTLAEAHTSLGFLTQIVDWNLTLAETHFRRAIELNPNSALAHGKYAGCLVYMQRYDEAHAEIDKAIELDPYNQLNYVGKGVYYLYSREYDKAIERFQDLMRLDKSYEAEARFWLALIYWKKGELAQSKAESEKTLILNHQFYNPGQKVLIYAITDHKKARELLAEMEKTPEKPYQAWQITQAYAIMDEKEKAFEWLEYVVINRVGRADSLLVNSFFDNMRSDPRFPIYLKRIGLSG